MKNKFLLLVVIAVLIATVASEYMRLPSWVDWVQNLVYFVAGISLTSASRRRDPLNSSNIGLELLQKEKHQLEEKIITLEKALEKAIE
jgi:membrane protein implicated in regulation of membrane protease activity